MTLSMTRTWKFDYINKYGLPSCTRLCTDPYLFMYSNFWVPDGNPNLFIYSNFREVVPIPVTHTVCMFFQNNEFYWIDLSGCPYRIKGCDCFWFLPHLPTPQVADMLYGRPYSTSVRLDCWQVFRLNLI